MSKQGSDNSYHTRQENARNHFARLKLDTGVRSNNEHAGTGLGGSPSEFWFLANHNIKVYLTDGDPSFKDAPESNTIIAYMPSTKDYPLSKTRKIFQDFFTSHKDRIDITKEQETDLQFLKTLEVKTIDARMFIEAVELAHELAHWLDIKIDFQKATSALYAKELDFLQKKFLKELNLPIDYFEKLEAKNSDRENRDKENLNGGDPMRAIFEAHPVWGAKYNLSKERHATVANQLLSSEDNGKLKALNGFPPYLVLQAVRSIIGIERIVTLNLDENDNWDILNRVNKVIDNRQ